MVVNDVHSGIKFRFLNIIKSIIPMRFLFYLRYFWQFLTPKTLKSPTSKRIYYLDAPDYGNLGDQAIALAIRKFSERELPEYEFMEVLQSEVASYFRWIKKNIRPEDIVFLTGGGNIGNKYRIYEATRRFLINNLSDNKVFIFPQSVDFSDDVFGLYSMKKAAKIYSKPNVTLFIRERVSLQKIKDLIPNAVLVPDIVLSMKKSDLPVGSSNREGIGICLRFDMESVLTTKDREQIRSFSKTKSSCTVAELSTISSIDKITEKNREKVISQLLERFSRCELIITDRLHAMIFSIITNTPCVVFDNKNHKISGVYEFVRNKCAVVLIHTTDELGCAVEKVQSSSCNFEWRNMYSIITELVTNNPNGQNS